MARPCLRTNKQTTTINAAAETIILASATRYLALWPFQLVEWAVPSATVTPTRARPLDTSSQLQEAYTMEMVFG